MLIGVSGCGKQSLTRLASFMLACKLHQIVVSKSYKPKDFRQDLKEQMLKAGIDAEPSTFMITDTQISYESFLEDINNILNTGEITNLYTVDENNLIFDSLQKVAQEQKRLDTRDGIQELYVERLRDNFHIILCMSPVGDILRIRCRMFPSLVNCCTLDWFDNWPEEALLNVSKRFISKIDQLKPEEKQNLSEMFMTVHK